MPHSHGHDSLITHRVAKLRERYGGLDGGDLLRPLIAQEFSGHIAVTSSFGAEAAVTLWLVAEIDPTVPVIFLDTGKHFPETLAYRDRLVARLGLRDVRSTQPAAQDLAEADANGDLWRRNPDLCCRLRKVLPLRTALADFDAWITGRKRSDGGTRSDLQIIEAVDERVKINPLANWTPARIADALAAANLPRHPLVAEGYPSIGCAPCTRRLANPSDVPRAGRWAGTGKTECGIHWPAQSQA